MKQSLAVALAGMQGLGSTDDHRERPVDRLAALAMAQAKRGADTAQEAALAALGARLIGFKWSNRSDFRADVEDMLSAALGWERHALRLSPKNRDKIARWALTEYSLPFCMTCRGAGETTNFQDVDGRQPMKTCPTCQGVKMRRYTDDERVEAMGQAFTHAMGIAHQILASSESTAMRGYGNWLGR